MSDAEAVRYDYWFVVLERIDFRSPLSSGEHDASFLATARGASRGGAASSRRAWRL